MENQLQVSNTHQSNIVLSEKEVELAKVIYHVNQLTNYPLSAIQIEDWSKSLNDLYPNLEIHNLKQIIKEMKLDKIEWDPKCGIQNITRALTDFGIYDEESIERNRKYKAQENDYTNERKPKMVY